MADSKNAKVFVNLGASQARRRLKGFGHGVRKVETAGNNQAVIIHTAIDDMNPTTHAAFDHERLKYRYSVRDFRLTDVHGEVVQELLA